ncbi:M13 family metallopeptidase [Halpernia frigidisoli]|uniref:Putative endopeptidase n=1 Tax=Halpernia frigidisoli TaxID=1125876 RepID=A0A1I3IIA9_9FLAO|nr:M13 family metallopeptidase [Halpernia frigidisoli]SFI47567.1 putative endopeptidase [Halpernia frigidisoli]
MKKFTISVFSLSAVLFFNLSNAQKKPMKDAKLMTTKSANVKDVGLNLTYGDSSVRPQDDFYNYVNGGWMKTAVIPSDKPSWGSFNELREQTDNSSLEILNKILSEKYTAGSEGQKIQALYASFSDLKTRDEQGINPIKSDLAKIDALNSIGDLQKYLIEATKTGDNPFYNWGVSSDLKNSNMNAIYLGGPSLGLGKDYYQKKNEANTKVLAEYQKYVASMLNVLGEKDASAGSERIVSFENKLASYLLTLEQGRDATLRYNPETMAQLKGLVKNVDLPTYLTSVGVNTDKVIIGELNYYKNMDSFMTESNLPLIKEYMKYNMLSGNAGSLSQKLDQMKFDFYSKYLQGQEVQRPIDKRGLGLVNGVLGEAFGKLYVDKYFPAEAKEQMLTMISYIKKGFKEHIANLQWMSPVTKEKAQEKLSKFTVKVAYPDKWKDYSKLALKSPSEGGTLYSNLQNVSDWNYQKKLEKIGKPVDKTEWGMTPQTVNAYYSSSNNEIVFPAAILQPPFFNFKADPAVNFGGIGAVIGHEISHGFDDSGSKFDGDGNLNNWWTDADRKNFDAATTKLGEQYSAYEPVKGTFVNGKFTMGENIGDLGGSSVAYDALQMYLKDHGNPGKISGLTQDQRFFMSWATVWRTKSTDKATSNQVKTDPHSPGYYRAFGPIINLDAFQKAFDLKPGDKLYKAPADRIRIW